jgi:hypothetical protein
MEGRQFDSLRGLSHNGPAYAPLSVGVRKRAGREENDHSVGVAYRRDANRPIRRPLRHPTRLSAQAQRGEALERSVDVDEERQHEQPRLKRLRGPLSRLFPADERVELEHPREDVRDVPIAEKYDTQSATRAFEQCRPIALDLTIQQNIETYAVMVEAHALIEIGNDDNRVMDRTGDPATLPTPGVRRESRPASPRGSST